MADFSPTNIGLTPRTISGCVGFYDFSDTSSITSSSNLVSVVRDENGSNTLTQATGANQPTTNARTINGKNALLFNGTSSRLVIPSNLFPEQTNGGLTMLVVAKSDLALTEQYLIGSTNAPRTYLTVTAAGNAASSISSSAVKNSGVTVGTDPFIFCVTNDGATDTVKLKVNAQAAVSFSQTNSGVPSSMILGSTNGGASFWNGVMGAVAFYNRALTDAEVLQLMRYFGNNWGISVA